MSEMDQYYPQRREETSELASLREQVERLEKERNEKHKLLQSFISGSRGLLLEMDKLEAELSQAREALKGLIKASASAQSFLSSVHNMASGSNFTDRHDWAGQSERCIAELTTARKAALSIQLS